MIVKFNNGGSAILTLGDTVKAAPAFELHLCKRDKLGKRFDQKSRVYGGDNPAAVEATFLRGLSNVEKKKNLYTIPT